MNRRLIFFISLNFLIFFSNGIDSYGQEYSWKYYSVSDGLPQTQVYCLFQDSQGIIWIGTKGGLSKFDGIEFENFTSKNGLNFDFVTRFQEDGKGGMYIGTKLGANHFKDGKIKPLTIPGAAGVSFYLVDKLGHIWLNENRGKLFCVKDGKRIEDHPIFSLLEEDELISNYHATLGSDEISIVTNHGKIITWNGLNVKLVLDKQKLYRPIYGADNQLFGVGKDSLYHISNQRTIPIMSMDNLAVRYISSKNDIYLVDKETASFLYHFDGNDIYEYEQHFNMIMDILIDDEKNLWIGTEAGLWRLQSRGFQNFLADVSNNYYTWTVLQDKDDNIWMGSYLYGIKKYDGRSITDVPIMHLFKGNGAQVFYSGGLKSQKGDVYFGTAQGVLELKNGQFQWLYQDKENDAILYTYEDVKNERFLAASARHGLIEFDEKGQINFHHDRTSRQNTGLVTCVLTDKFDRIWISGKQGVSIKERGKWTDLPSKNDSIPFGAISMIMDSHQNIWLGTNQGIYVYDYHRLRRVGEEVFDEQIGVLNISDNDELLIGSIKGIGLLDLNRFYDNGDSTIRFFDSNNGFLGTECKHNSSFKDNTGNIWICTSDRVVKVNPSELKSDPNPPRIYIKNISILSEDMAWQSVITDIDEYKEHSFDPDNDDLRFYYHGISHAAPLGVKYRTILEGYDKEWSAVTSERYRTFTNLPKGKFTFKVMASNIDGVWTEDASSFHFSIKPNWHEMSTVRIGGLIFMVFFAAGLGYVYSERLKRITHSKEQNEKRIAKLQFKSLQGLIDPHFTFNAINSIAAMVYKENRDEAYQYFTKFSRLIRTAFDNSEQTTRTINDEVKFVTNYLDIEKMRFKDRFEYRITTDKNINYDWKIPKMIIQIYVENAIKHGLINKESGGILEIVLALKKDNLEIIIRDNGVGREYSKGKKDKASSLGRGTTIMKDYFNLLNKFNDQKIYSKTMDLINNEGNPAGTEVIVSIPLSFKYSI